MKTPRVHQIVVAVVAIAGSALLTATVLARPAPAALHSSVREPPTFMAPESLGDNIASSGEDTGPGCAESEVAKLPEENR
jgi:hypothetical protein